MNLMKLLPEYDDIRKTHILRMAINITHNFRIFEENNTHELKNILKKIFYEVEKKENMVYSLLFLLINRAEPFFDDILDGDQL